MTRTTSAAIQTIHHLGQKKQIARISRTSTATLLAVEQIPGGHKHTSATICIVKEAKERMDAKDLAEAAS